MKPGETKRLYCELCMLEFEVTLEPKVREGMGAGGIPSKTAEYCPFCGDDVDSGE